MLLVLALSGAPGTMLLATVLATVPVGPLVACYLWLDRYEPEPRRLLAAGLLWGGFVATAVAILLQGIGGIFVGISDETSLAVVAPVTEEATKGAFLLLLLWWRRAELDGILDGIVYAGMVGIGFAFVENILYLAAAYNGTDGTGPGGTTALTATFVVRCLFSPFAHPFFTTLHRHRRRASRSPAGHATAAHRRAPGGLPARRGRARGLERLDARTAAANFFLVYLVLMAPAFLGAVGFAVWARRSERKMLTAALGDAAARGLIPATDIGWVVDLRRPPPEPRSTPGGWAATAGLEAMRDYQQAVVELGFLHNRYLRGTPPPDFAARGHEYVARIAQVRPFIAFPGQVVPQR